MDPHPLSIETFQDLLDRHGGDLARWPFADRQAAESLLSQSEEAKSLLAAALRLDAALATQPKAPAGLADRIVAASGAKRSQ